MRRPPHPRPYQAWTGAAPYRASPQPQGVSLLNYVNAATFIFDLFSLLDSTLGYICGFVFLFFIRGFMVIDEKVGKATSSLESLRVERSSS